jgi:hypothetical protein
MGGQELPGIRLVRRLNRDSASTGHIHPRVYRGRN